ncbi:hypothetical protein L2E82_28711 [Cichorium intybus]|uniref:Uncharacterized protein n=1 Tax=Cichorium intybus TaxID=13427 RepID=A0ACB9CWV8_CICIN|nr:hypothetical protein L2E82_28711 [Cichorium intybus]
MALRSKLRVVPVKLKNPFSVARAAGPIRPNEYLTSISGTVGTVSSYGVSDVVMSLCFHTNQKRYGPYGSCIGTRFSCDGKGVDIVGFHGRVDNYVNAIGIYVIPKSLAFDRNSTREDSSTHEMSLMAMPREAGPWGACGAKPWDDGVFFNVKNDGQSVLSQIHGGTNGEKIEVVHFDGTDEYLAGISGFYGPVEGHNGLELGSYNGHYFSYKQKEIWAFRT